MTKQKEHKKETLMKWRKEDLPHGCLWHVIKSKSKLGKTVYKVRRVTWESYIIRITIHGDDGLFFVRESEANRAFQALRDKEQGGTAE